MSIILKARKRVITLLLVAGCAIWLTPSWNEVGLPFFLLWLATLMMLFGSQVFWIDRGLDIVERFVPGKPRCVWLDIMAAVVYGCFFFAYNFAPLKMLFTGHIMHASDPRFYRTLIDGIFSVWLVGSFIGFGLVVFFWITERVVRSATWLYRQVRAGEDRVAPARPDTGDLQSTARRHLLGQMAIAVSTVSFGAAAYGLLHERLNVEVTRRQIALARLPKAFEGFRIALLSDFHISSFMPADEIRRSVMLSNQLKTDLVVLTGDYLSWDPAAQAGVVGALAGLRTPNGVFGCLGNHETITRTEASITQMFAAQGIRILRQEQASIRIGKETLNLLNRLEVEDESAFRERSSDPLGLESCAATARDTAKRRERIGGVGH